MLRKILKGIVITLVILSLIIGGFFTFVLVGKSKTLGLKIDHISAKGVPDGVYTGSYKGYRWSNTVKVSVKDHRITNIEVVHPQVFAKKETIETLKERIEASQSLNVDTVTGATADSKAYLKAIENALKTQKKAKN